MWEYVVRPDRLDEIEHLYGPQGEWSQLFGRSTGYVRTELYRHRSRSNHYVTVDHWQSYDAWHAWRVEFDAQSNRLDGRGDGLTTHEREIGRFESTTEH